MLTRAAVAAVSVVVPARDRAGTVGRAVRSALDQEPPVLEVIVVDDGSADGTPEAARAAAGGDARLRVLRHDSPRGAQAARNAGIRAARGAWIAFLDSDDELLPGSVALRLAAAEASGAPVVHSECLVVRAPGGAPEPFGVPPLAGAVHGALLRAPGPVFPALLVRREALERIGGLDEGIVSYQEWDTAIRLAREGPFAFVAAPTFVYHFYGAGTISADRLREARGYEQVVARHGDAMRRVLGAGGLAEHWESAARIRLRAGDGPGARRCLLRAVALRPFGRSLLRRIGMIGASLAARGAGG